MTAEFNWWLLLLGLVVGGGLTWLVLADTRRREQDLEEDDLAQEAVWLEARMAEEGTPLPADTLERVVQLHRAYLAIAPPDEARDEDLTSDEGWLTDTHPDEVARPVTEPGEAASSPPRHSSREDPDRAPAETSWRPRSPD
jgi:hypothetical protein